MVSLMSDARLVFLMWFVGIAVVIAAILIFVEIRLKKIRAREAAARKEKTPIDLMRERLQKEKNLRKKLDIVGDSAKNFFKEKYGIDLKSDYSELAKEFKKRGLDLEVEFCEKMFEGYYSGKKFDVADINNVAGLFEKTYMKKRAALKACNSPGLGDRVDMVIEEVVGNLAKKVEKKIEVKKDKEDRRVRVEARAEHEILSWIRNAIRMGYDRSRLSALLDDGKRSKKEVKRLLEVYDREFPVVVAKGVQNSGEGGIAQRILKNQKERLEGEVA